MEAKRTEISTLLRAVTEISKQLNITRMTVHRVEQRQKASESLKERPQSGRYQVISQVAIKNTFENYPWQKMTRLT